MIMQKNYSSILPTKGYHAFVTARMQSTISIDTAIETISFLIAELSRQADKIFIQIEKQQLENRIDELSQEIDILYGLEGSYKDREKLFDKVVNEYCPEVKNAIKSRCRENFL